MPFVDIFRERIKIETCQVVCWTDASGSVMEYTEIPILANHSEKFNEWIKRQSSEVVPPAIGEELDAYAQDVVESAVANRPVIASETAHPIASNLRVAIQAIEKAYNGAKEEFLREDPAILTEGSDLEMESAKWNLELLKSFCEFYVADRDGGTKGFWLFQSYLHPGNGHLYDIPVPVRYDDGFECTCGETVDFQKAYYASSFRIAYLVSNLFEYCFALLDYLTRTGCRLEKCKRCGRYFVPRKHLRNTKYCDNIDPKKGESCLTLSKTRKKEDIRKKIIGRLSARRDFEASVMLERFLKEDALHRQRVKQRKESEEEYQEWLEEQDKLTRIRPRKSS